jgi:uncharacterized protein YndB with AHSA1/START domain
MSEAGPPAPFSTTGMLIRRPADEVFRAFVDPAITSQFWFSRSSGPLAAGRTVDWIWDRYGVTAPVTVQALEPDRRIVVTWPGYGGETTVDWAFAPRDDGTTFVTITETGFTGDADTLRQQVAASTEGFTLVLAGLKALLEHGIQLNLVADRFPDGIQPH